MATKKGGKKAGKKGGGKKGGGKKGGTKKGREEEITRTSRLQYEPSTGAQKHLRPTRPCKRNDETFKRSSSFLFIFEYVLSGQITPILTTCYLSLSYNLRFHRTQATSRGCVPR